MYGAKDCAKNLNPKNKGQQRKNGGHLEEEKYTSDERHNVPTCKIVQKVL